MAITLNSTKDFCKQNGIKMLVYGQSGVGKTSLAKTAEKPIILAIERGLLTLSDFDLPYIDINNKEELTEAYNYLKDNNDFETIFIDSLSRMAELLMQEEKPKNKDARQAYMIVEEQINRIIEAFLSINKNVVFIAKLKKQEDELSNTTFMPALPGEKMTQKLPYFFDEVFALRILSDDKGLYRVIQTGGDGRWIAKDSSTKLELWEEPNLTKIFNKIGGHTDGGE